MERNEACELVQDEFLTFSQTAQRFPAFSEGSLRWMRFNGDANDFNKCVKKVGRKCVISVRKISAMGRVKNSINQQQTMKGK
jgi:hypothetical protein